MPFPSVLGHDRVKALLARALGQGRLPPALLLTGPEGVGKRTLALAAARGLLCENGPGEPCGTCRTCDRAGRSLHPDLIVVVTSRVPLGANGEYVYHLRPLATEIPVPSLATGGDAPECVSAGDPP